MNYDAETNEEYAERMKQDRVCVYFENGSFCRRLPEDNHGDETHPFVPRSAIPKDVIAIS